MLLAARTIDLFLQVYVILIFVRVLMSWIRPPSSSPLLRSMASFVYATTEPLLGPIRQVLPAAGGIDFSPLLAIVLINMLRPVLWRFLTVTLRF